MSATDVDALRWPWIERTFSFDFPAEKFPDIVSRLAGVPARVEDLVKGLPEPALVWRDAPGTWCIKQNVGHLIDLEPLLMGRLDDFEAGRETLRPADMTNRATHEANHEARPITELLGALRAERAEIVARLEALDIDILARTATHPRLRKTMRVVDACFFAAEHDDYHLARIAQLIRRRRAAKEGRS